MEDFEAAVQRNIQDDNVQSLLKQFNGRNLNLRLNSGWTALIHACSSGKELVVKCLLDHGADANCSHELFTPLMAVCSSSCCDEERLANCARALIKFNADVNAMDKFKSTPLMLACIKGHEIVVSILLDTKCDLNQMDNDGYTALHLACIYKESNIVQLLLNHGANKLLKDRRGRLPVAIAITKGLDDVVQMLEESSTDGNKNKIQHQVTYVRKKTSFEDLLSQLPCYFNSSGKDGFHNDVKILLSGMRFEHKEELFLQKKVSLAQFLNMKNDQLKDLGIHLSFHRDKIITGNKRFILHPWGSFSLPQIDQQDRNIIDMMFIVRTLANSVKHLHILWASVLYCNERIILQEDDQSIGNLYQITLQTFRQTKALISVLKSMQQQIEYVEKVDKCQQGDLILPKKPTHYFTVGKIAIMSAVLGFGIWKSNAIGIFRK